MWPPPGFQSERVAEEALGGKQGRSESMTDDSESATHWAGRPILGLDEAMWRGPAWLPGSWPD